MFTHSSRGEILTLVWIQPTASVLMKNSVSTIRVMSVSHVYNYKRNRGDRALRQERHGHTVTPYLLPLALIAASIAVPCMGLKLCWGESLRPHWSHRVHKLKELINLSILCNFQLFPRSNYKGNSSHRKLRNCWVTKPLISAYFLCKVSSLSTIIPLKLFGISGSNFNR